MLHCSMSSSCTAGCRESQIAVLHWSILCSTPPHPAMNIACCQCYQWTCQLALQQQQQQQQQQQTGHCPPQPTQQYSAQCCQAARGAPLDLPHQVAPPGTTAAAAPRPLPGTVRMVGRLLGLLVVVLLSAAAAVAAGSAAAAAAASAALAVTGGSASPMVASGASGAWEAVEDRAAATAADGAGAAWMDAPTSSCRRERRCRPGACSSSSSSGCKL
jgi:hypothetical protein